MLKQRKKREYPPGTFIPKPARVCAIIQLCLAFSIILWNASQPFVGEIFTLKSELLFYQDLIGIPVHENLSSERLDRLARNAERFQALPKMKQEKLINEMNSIQKEFSRPISSKLKDVVKIFAFNFSPYELLWLLLSIILPILLLKRVDGATQAIWLLPLLVGCYALDNRWYGAPVSPSPDTLLFPSEGEIVSNYIDGGLSPNVFEQKEQLMEGWSRYLIINWSKEQPSDDPKTFLKQGEKAEFLFNLARLDLLAQKASSSPRNNVRDPIWLLALYFFWNVFFAYTVTRHLNPICDPKSSLNLGELVKMPDE